MQTYSVKIDGIEIIRQALSNTGFICRLKSEGLIKMDSKVTELKIIK